MLHQSHAGVTGPAFLVVVAHDVLVVGVRVLCQVSLDQISGRVCGEPGMVEGRSRFIRGGKKKDILHLVQVTKVAQPILLEHQTDSTSSMQNQHFFGII